MATTIIEKKEQGMTVLVKGNVDGADISFRGHISNFDADDKIKVELERRAGV